ncbi:MAG: AbrB family transcriptional regulator [Alphaproteobacteria bacterium]
MRRPVTPKSGDLRALALALAIGAAGGAAFAWARMPLAWMMGAMCLTTASALAGVKPRVPPPLRALMVAVLGVMLGSAFRPEMLERAGQWGVSLSALPLYLSLAAALVVVYFRRFARYDRTTAYFAAIPGGLNEMILVGSAMGGDDRTIALTHASRILLVVLIVPFWFRLVAGYVPPDGGVGAAFAPLATVPPFDLLVLAACGAAGYFAARALRLPAAALTGPMALSAAAHLAGLTESKPPSEFIVIAQVVVGSAIGCRFAGVPVKRVLRAIAVAAGSTVLLLTVTVAFSLSLSAATGLPTQALVLAFAPGGLAEMSLIALALGVDPAFVSTHHVVRIFLVVVLAPLVWRALARALARRSPATRQPAKGD